MLNKLKSDYEELEIKPSSDLWDRLDGKLDRKPEIALKSSFQWWKYAAVIVLLISLGSLFYFNSNKPQSEKVQVAGKTSENILKPVEKQNEVVALKVIKNQVSSESGKKNSTSNSLPEKFAEKIELAKDIAIAEKENKIVKVPEVLAEEKETNLIKPIVAERKKASYISADDLLLGRELDKAREENYNDQRKFGVIDMSKIKIKGPNSLKILGFTVISDSLKSK